MAKWLSVKNAQAFHKKTLPSLHVKEFREDIINYIHASMRIVQFYGRVLDDRRIAVMAVVADDTNAVLLVAETVMGQGSQYASLTQDVPALHMFEREIYEQTGVIPQHHPWLKPVRYESTGPMAGRLHSYPFYAFTGGELHEVAVGPVHAGVIEPGHFRFLCHGEDIYHLEIQLGYQHRGVELLMKTGNIHAKSSLAESIAGDTVIAHAWAYAMAVEGLTQTTISKRAEAIRAIALELERIAMHLVGLGGIAADIGFLPGASVYGRLRTAIINTMLSLSGCRFGRGLVRPGGTLFDIDHEVRDKIVETVNQVEHDIDIMNTYFFENPGVMSRLEHTGTVSTENAWKTGLVGFIARTCGLPVDSRLDQPFGLFVNEKFTPKVINSGDTYARAKLRALEITQSIELIRKWLGYAIMTGPIKTPVTTVPQPEHIVVSIVEGWRGNVVHIIVTGNNSNVEHYKVLDPSFHNWFALALAVRDNGISDFPVCNKSFDQSYAGFDL